MADETTPTTAETTTTETPAAETPSAQGNGASEAPAKPPAAKPNETAAEKAMRQIAEDEYNAFMADRAFVDHYVKMEKENPKQLLMDMLKANPDARRAIEDLILEEEERRIAEANLTPEQKRIRELESYKKQIEDEKKAKEAEAAQAVQEQAEQEVVSEIKSVIELGGFDRTPLVAETVRAAIETAIKSGLDYKPEDIVAFVHHKFKTTTFSKLSRLQDDALLDEIGDDMLKKIRSALLARQEKLKKAGVFPKPGQKPDRVEKKDKKLRSWQVERDAVREERGQKRSESKYMTPDQARRALMRGDDE